MRTTKNSFRLLIILFFFTQLSYGQNTSIGKYPPFTKWYQNPLGISPVSLHTSNGIVLPAIGTIAILIITKKDTSLVNRLAYFNEIGISKGYYASKTTVYQNNLGFLYQIRKYMSLGTEFSIVYVTDKINNTWGLGIRPFVRFYPINKERFKLFIQSGAGLILFTENFPKPSGFFGDNREGTKLNGSPKYGIGSEFKLNKRLSGQIGLWHIHFSNGNYPSRDRNPGHDSNGFTVGLIYNPSNDKN